MLTVLVLVCWLITKIHVLILHKYCQNRYLMFFANMVEKSRRSTNKHKYSGENSGKNLPNVINNVFLVDIWYFDWLISNEEQTKVDLVFCLANSGTIRTRYKQMLDKIFSFLLVNWAGKMNKVNCGEMLNKVQILLKRIFRANKNC